MVRVARRTKTAVAVKTTRSVLLILRAPDCCHNGHRCGHHSGILIAISEALGGSAVLGVLYSRSTCS